MLSEESLRAARARGMVQPLYTHPARLAAEKAGRPTFDPGFPCMHGHRSDRGVGGALDCLECRRISRAKHLAKQQRK
jgi:hypothetical protein